MKRNFLQSTIGIIIALLLPCASFAHIAHADTGLVVRPAVIDAQGLPRDINTYTITVTNTAGHMLATYASVFNITADGAQAFTDASLADKSTSLANWISVSRGEVDIMPGESHDFAVTIQAGPYAASGKYHAKIAFGAGSTRADAEANLATNPAAIINYEVLSNIKEEMEIRKFAAAAPVLNALPAKFIVVLGNIGNTDLAPAGVLRIYNRNGEEMGETQVNAERAVIAAGTEKEFDIEWNGHGLGFGQYKGVLTVTYGSADTRIEDTASFWLLPIWEIAAVFAVFLALTLGAGLIIHKRYEAWHRSRVAHLERLIRERKTAGGGARVVDLRPPRKETRDM